MPLDVLIEGFLFYKSSPQKKATLIKLFDISEGDYAEALSVLRARLEDGATRLIETDNEIQLVLRSEMSPVIEAMRKNELKNDIGKAGAETLAIILYRGPVSRYDIDQIRGVNSSFILRNLLIRGLVDRVFDKKHGTYKFSVTSSLLAHLGVTTKTELPDFAKVNDSLDSFMTETDNK